MTITEFLEARISEDEREARVAKSEFAHGGFGCYGPARVLAECAAKRAIVGELNGWIHEYNDEDMWYSCGLAVSLWGDEPDEPGSGCSDESKQGRCTCGLERRKMLILKPLAAVYASHPDYEQGWAL